MTRDGQIAHLDHDRSNNKEDNLVYLCLRHHNMYDSKTSQSKGFTKGEMRHYREELFKKLGESLKGGVGDAIAVAGFRWSALELLGGRRRVCRSIVSALRLAREERGLSSAEVERIAGLKDDAVKNLEKKPDILDSNTALSLMSVLSIKIDDVLAIPPLSATELQQWRVYLRNIRLTLTPIARAGDVVDLSGDVALVFFIRFKAISELDDYDQSERRMPNQKRTRGTSCD